MEVTIDYFRKPVNWYGMSQNERKQAMDKVDWDEIARRFKKAEREAVGDDIINILQRENLRRWAQAELDKLDREEDRRWQKRVKTHKKMWQI